MALSFAGVTPRSEPSLGAEVSPQTSARTLGRLSKPGRSKATFDCLRRLTGSASALAYGRRCAYGRCVPADELQTP